jgi:hypothetical protein
MLYAYAFLFVLLILVSGLGSKNVNRRREIRSMGRFNIFLFVFVSVMASSTPFLISQPSDPLQASMQFLTLYGISTTAFIIAITEITIYSQRLSLCDSLGLTSVFLKKQKKIWSENLADFPNSDNIVNSIGSASAVTELFSHGSFGLALLWSFAVMEQTIDEVAESVILRNPA